jgi:hypothetical protein
VKARSLAGLLGAGALLIAGPGWAAPDEACEIEGVWCGPVLPPRLAPAHGYHFLVSMGAEAWNSQFSGSDFFLALATTLRVSAFAPYVQLMARPGIGTEDYENTRLLAGAGLRAYLPIWDQRLSYAIGLLGELRFEEHFWLAYATPIELGAVVYRKHSLEIEVFAGARRAFAGALINSFLLDPNGFENEDAAERLGRARNEDAWHGFARIVISRRID